MKEIKRKNRIHRTSGFIYLFLFIIFPSAVFSQPSTNRGDSEYLSVLANPLVSRSFMFLSVNEPRAFGGSIGKSFTLYSRKTTGGHFSLAGNASAHSLTHRNKTIFYLRDVDYLLGGNVLYNPTNGKYWMVFSLQHISSHLGDEFFLDMNQAGEYRRPITFSLEFVQFILQKYWSDLRIETGGNYVYHSTVELPRFNYFLAGEKELFTIASNHRIFTSVYFSYSLSWKTVLQQVFQLGVKYNFPNIVPFVFTFEARTGRLFWGQFYWQKRTEYLLKLYLLI